MALPVPRQPARYLSFIIWMVDFYDIHIVLVIIALYIWTSSIVSMHILFKASNNTKKYLYKYE